MRKMRLFIKIPAVLGTILVWLPILTPFLFSAAAFTIDQRFRFDYLIPAELFPLALTGGGLLVWASFYAKLHRKLILWSLGTAVGFLIGGQVLAVVTGLASGEIEPTGWPWLLVMASIILYSIMLIVIGSGGILLLRDLFIHSPAKKTND